MPTLQSQSHLGKCAFAFCGAYRRRIGDASPSPVLHLLARASPPNFASQSCGMCHGTSLDL
eukprot:4976618-Pyramimonas_sp.AAC.1